MEKKLRKVELYKFEIGGHTLALDVKKSKVFRIEDELTSKVIDLLDDLTPDEIINSLADRYGREPLSGVMKELEKARIITDEDQKGEVYPPSPAKEITGLCLYITYDCNLRCKYCYYNDGNPHHGSKIDMSEPVAEKAVDFLIKESGNKENLSINFFGGEPLLNFDLIREVVKYAKEKTAKAKKRINFSVTTNGTLLNESVVKYLVKNKIGVLISMDGHREIHDSARVFSNGRGSYNKVAANARRFLRKGSATVRATITHQNPRFMEAVNHLLGFGFGGVAATPASGTDGVWAIRGNDFKEIMEEYDRAAEYFLEKIAKNEHFVFYNFLSPLGDVYFTKRRRYYCGAALFYLAVSPEGNLYPCHRFVGMDDFVVGNLSVGFDNDWREKFLENYVENKKECKECWARYLCGGGCPYCAVEANGDLRMPDEARCDLRKHILKLSLLIYSQIHQKDKEILGKLFDPNLRPYMQNPDPNSKGQNKKP